MAAVDNFCTSSMCSNSTLTIQHFEYVPNNAHTRTSNSIKWPKNSHLNLPAFGLNRDRTTANVAQGTAIVAVGSANVPGTILGVSVTTAFAAADRVAAVAAAPQPAVDSEMVDPAVADAAAVLGAVAAETEPSAASHAAVAVPLPASADVAVPAVAVVVHKLLAVPAGQVDDTAVAVAAGSAGQVH